MAESTPTQTAEENDLKNNRLGLLSQRQIEKLEQDIEDIQQLVGERIRQGIGLGVIVTIAIVILVFVRVLPFPIALFIEAGLVIALVVLTTDYSRFAQSLVADKEAGAVRIVKGNLSRLIGSIHPLYYLVRVEVRNYKVLDNAVYRSLKIGNLYQLYVLPHSGIIVSCEEVEEVSPGYLR